MSKKTALLDLDGTLLPMDIDEFLKGYFKLLTKEFSGIFPAEDFINNLMYATNRMIKNNGDRTNSEVFIEEFFNLYQVDNQEEIMRMFEVFYQEKFPLLKSQINHDGIASRLIEVLKKDGYQLVLATNPIFPLEAIEERLRWVDITPEDFSLISNYENMHYCKPNIEYYQEIIDLLDVNIDDCIMIGNDVQEDMIAGELGMQTYLVTDFLIDRRNKDFSSEFSEVELVSEKINIDWQGTLKELLNHFEN
ncbi:MAG: HAD family hydrolase [Halanaerobiales bacterium]